jgi:hypothetical protein
MKIRTGFVSNSSSSSYLVVTTKENHEAALAAMEEVERAAFEIFANCADFAEMKKFGKNLVSLAYISGEAGNDEIDEEAMEAFVEKYKLDEDESNDLVYSEVFDKWKDLVQKDKENTLYNYQSF